MNIEKDIIIDFHNFTTDELKTFFVALAKELKPKTILNYGKIHGRVYNTNVKKSDIEVDGIKFIIDRK
jgi:hypothetical protein